MNTYYIWTIGCQVNVADSGKLAAGLRRLGWDPTDRPDDADFIVLNANPLDDITNTRSIDSVYMRGTAVDRAGLRADSAESAGGGGR